MKGYLKIQITGYSPERFLNLCKNKAISVWGLESKGNSYEMYITVKDFKKLKPILRKTKTKLRILERCGTPFFLYKYRKRKLFFCGIFLCLALVYTLSLFVWKIEITGNSTITDDVLMEYLELEKVYHGMKISKVDCEKIGTNIRKNFDDIIWVSVSQEGTNIIIHVKENTDTFQVGQIEEEYPANIIATADGTITKIITRSGVPCVKVGDAVKKGDLLVSGIVEVKNDAGEVVREDYKKSDADIFAEVYIEYEDFCENIEQVKAYKKQIQKQLYLKILDYQIGFGIKKTELENYERQSQEKTLKFHENFVLPISYGMYEGKVYDEVKRERSKQEQETILDENFENFCRKLKEADAVILENNIQLKEEANGIRATGYLKVEQPIGTMSKTIDF